MQDADTTLAPFFRAVGEALRTNRESLNAEDPYNGNHGDHMVAIFAIAAHAAEQLQDAPPADAMQAAADLLRREQGNDSALVYANGLEQMAQQLSRYNISADEFLGYVRNALEEDGEAEVQASTRSSEVLKALVNGLVGWKGAERQRGAEKQRDADHQQLDEEKEPAENRWTAGLRQPSDRNGERAGAGSTLELGALFDLGVAYMQAKSRSGSRSQVLADAAASASPLSQVPHRYLSGKLAIQALLDAIRQG